MSKRFRVITALVPIFLLAGKASAQTAVVEINVDVAGRFATVKGTTAGEPRLFESKSFYFSKRSGLDRVSEVVLTGENGEAVNVKKLQPGEYISASDFSRFKYRVDLSPPANNGLLAGVSWLGSYGGLLFLDDLLPQKIGRATVAAAVGSGSKIILATEPSGETENGVAAIGPALRQTLSSPPSRKINFVTGDNWLFGDAEALSMANEIYDSYEKVFGDSQRRPVTVFLARPPATSAPGEWQAETRGGNVVIVSSDSAFRTQSIQRLHEQLRHELFHVWLPNGVNLNGKFDWFYEGFALYQSLKAGVSLSRIRFEDFLDTLSRAYDIDSHQSRRLSLVEASVNRFAGSETSLYARGMLAAFLIDIAILDRTSGKKSVADLLKAIYLKYRPPAASVGGTEAVIGMIREFGVSDAKISEWIYGRDVINWSREIAAAGLSASEESILSVARKPSGRQKVLLDKLGYNRWRRSTTVQK